MSAGTLARCVLGRKLFDLSKVTGRIAVQVQPQRHKWKPVNVPKPGVDGISYRRIVHYESEYTIEPLETTHLGGRDPITGRVVASAIGGGVKHKYHWVVWHRDGPTDLEVPPKEEKVLAIIKDGCRTAYVALVGSGRELKYIVATENMKVGDILQTHKGIPPNPVRPKEGDAYPLGALPTGTKVCCVEKYPGHGGCFVHAAGTFATIQRGDESRPGNIVIKTPSKKEFSLDKLCMATVGRVSNIEHDSIPVGSPQKMRELGNRPRSGLWHKKTGVHGRKIKPIPPVKVFQWKDNFKKGNTVISMTVPSIM